MEPYLEDINLLVLSPKGTHQNNFIGDLRGFSQSEDYHPEIIKEKLDYEITYEANFRKYRIICGSLCLTNKSQSEVSSQISKIQNRFFQPQKLNAIIFVIPPQPLHYEHFLTLNLFNNFSKDDMAMIEKNLLFVFVHDESLTYEKTCAVDEDLWTVLDRIGANLLHSKTFHCHSRMTRDFCNRMLQFIIKNKTSLIVETVYSHESVLKAVGNEDFLEIIIEAACVNEDNMFFKAAGENKQYYLYIGHSYKITCTNKKCLKVCCFWCDLSGHKKYDLGTCKVLRNQITCTECNCLASDHKVGVQYEKQKYKSLDQTTEQQKNCRQILITIMLTIDLFLKEHDARSMGQMYDRLKEKVEQDPRYSVLETMYEYEMGRCQKEITSDDCLQCFRKLLPSLDGFTSINDYLKRSLMEIKGNLLRVKF